MSACGWALKAEQTGAPARPRCCGPREEERSRPAWEKRKKDAQAGPPSGPKPGARERGEERSGWAGQ